MQYNDVWMIDSSAPQLMVFLFALVRLSPEDHSAGEIIQVNKGWGYHDWGGIACEIFHHVWGTGAYWNLHFLTIYHISFDECVTTSDGKWWRLQNKLITVTPDTKVLRAMQLMTGKICCFLYCIFLLASLFLYLRKLISDIQIRFIHGQITELGTSRL